MTQFTGMETYCPGIWEIKLMTHCHLKLGDSWRFFLFQYSPCGPATPDTVVIVQSWRRHPLRLTTGVPAPKPKAALQQERWISISSQRLMEDIQVALEILFCAGFLFFFFFNFGFIYLFIYLWLCWVFISVRGLSLVAASGGHSSSRCAGLSLLRPLLLRSTGSRHAGSVIVAHGPSCSTACGIFPDQVLNPCPLHWQADSQPLCHQGSPCAGFAWKDSCAMLDHHYLWEKAG